MTGIHRRDLFSEPTSKENKMDWQEAQRILLTDMDTLMLPQTAKPPIWTGSIQWYDKIEARLTMPMTLDLKLTSEFGSNVIYQTYCGHFAVFWKGERE